MSMLESSYVGPERTQRRQVSVSVGSYTTSRGPERLPLKGDMAVSGDWPQEKNRYMWREPREIRDG